MRELTFQPGHIMPARQGYGMPFAQPPNVRPLTQSVVCFARSSAVLLRKVLPVQSARALQVTSMCSSDPNSSCPDGDPKSPGFGGVLEGLRNIFAGPARAESQTNSSAGTLSGTEVSSTESQSLPLRYPAADRIVAIGDVHGDMRAFRRSLRAAGVIDENGDWAGGKTVLVQVGDQLDRGDDEREIYETLFRLQDTAPASGGAVHIILGNHELINLQMDYRYVTEGGFADFQRNGGVAPLPKSSKIRIPPTVMKTIKDLPQGMQARARALCPGGPLAVELAKRAQIAVIVGDNVFVHGGLSPTHLTYGGKPPSAALRTLQGINDDTREYMLGQGKTPQVLRGSRSPVWMRDYSAPRLPPSSDACRMLGLTLKMIKAKRMIVGHTPQTRGINAACSGRVWRIDTGMSAAYGGVPEALEISKGGRIRVFSHKLGAIQGSARAR